MAAKRQSAAEVLRVKSLVRERDGLACTACGMTADEHRAAFGKTLDVHRTTPGSLYTIEGCVTLCVTCHQSQPSRKPGEPDLANGPQFRYTLCAAPAWLARIEVQAKRFGTTTSGYIRRAVIGRMERDEASDPR